MARRYGYSQTVKILLVAPGNSLHTARWVKRLLDAGQEILLFNSSETISKSINDSHLYHPPLSISTNSSSRKILNVFGTKLLNDFFITRNQLREAISLFKPDIIHVHWLLTPAALGCAFIDFENIIVTPWGSDILPSPNTEKWNLFKKIIWKLSIFLIVRNAKGICADGKNSLNELLKYNRKVKYLEIVRFGINANLFSPVNRNEKFYFQARASIGTKVVISTRTLNPLYDIETLLDAAKKVLTYREDVIFAIFGDGMQRISLEKKSAKLEIETKVIFYGNVSESILAGALASSDLFVSTSKSDGGIAQSISEAMASSIPILVSNISENNEWINQSKGGDTFTVGDSGELADLILLYLADTENSKQTGARGRQFVLKENEARKQTAKMINFYNQVRM